MIWNKIDFIKSTNGFKMDVLNDPFFDSLKNDYPGFDEWYKKSKNDERKSGFYWFKSSNLIAFLGLKIENETLELSTTSLGQKKRIKMATIKSSEDEDLSSFSQMAIYIATQKARREKIEEIYFSIFLNNEDKKKLVKIFKEFGFREIGGNENQERVFLKDVSKKSSSDWRENYPWVPHVKNRKWTYLPIESTYHDRYIQGAILRNTPQYNDFSKMAIKKAYIHSQDGIMELSKNDGLLIYRISEVNKAHKSCITSYGTIIENIPIFSFNNNFEKFRKKVRNYHAFNEHEVKRWFGSYKYITIFALNKSLGENQNINYKMLLDNGYWKDSYPSANIFSDNDVKKILQLKN